MDTEKISIAGHGLPVFSTTINSSELIRFAPNGDIFIRGELALQNKEFTDKLIDALKEWTANFALKATDTNR